MFADFTLFEECAAERWRPFDGKKRGRQLSYYDPRKIKSLHFSEIWSRRVALLRSVQDYICIWRSGWNLKPLIHFSLLPLAWNSLRPRSRFWVQCTGIFVHNTSRSTKTFWRGHLSIIRGIKTSSYRCMPSLCSTWPLSFNASRWERPGE